MIRCLLFGAAFCLPVAMYAQTNAVSPAQIASLQTDMRLVKQKFLELLTEMDDWTNRIKALEVQNHSLMERLNELETETGARDEDLSGRVAVLEEHAISEDFVAKVEDNLEGLQSLNRRFEELEARIGAAQVSSSAEVPSADGADPPNLPLERSFVARTDDSGRLISLYRREIDSAQVEILVLEDDCEMVGAWFDRSFATRDYNAFFVRSDRGVRVCEKLSGGWRSLRASETRRAHVIMEPL